MKSDLVAAVRSLRYAGLDAVREFLNRTYFSLWSRSTPDPVLDADWDLLVVLDACRADVFQNVVGSGTYEFPVSGTATSPASSSTEWLDAVFGAASDDDLADLAYVTGNPYSSRTVDTDRFGHCEEVWRHAWDDDLGTIPPRPVTDAAIRAGRLADTDRMVVHYMQPHFPAVFDDRDGSGGADGSGSDGDGGGVEVDADGGDGGTVGDDAGGDGGGMALEDWGDKPMSVWEELRFGERDADAVWNEYERNLEAVLEDVALLLENVDAPTAVLTADHGNAFGEHHIYGHPGGVDIPALREVPWSVTSATDERTHEPGRAGRGDEADEADEETVDERLESLGYKV